MRYIPRQLAPVLLDAFRHFPVVVVTGPRRAGKTSLLRKLFPTARYVLLEDPDMQERVRSYPRAFLEELQPPVLFDGFQNTPELLDYVRTLVDTRPRRVGQWLFTDSQEAPLMRGITESMAGRAAILQLLPFSLRDRQSESIARRLPRSAGPSQGSQSLVRLVPANIPRAGCPSDHKRSRPGDLPSVSCACGQPSRSSAQQDRPSSTPWDIGSNGWRVALHSGGEVRSF
jgi:AAA domain